MNRDILFLIRKNPASTGGIQRHTARLLDGVSGYYRIEKIVWRGPEWGAPLYFPLFYFRSAGNGAGLVHCDDAVTAIIGSAVRRNTGKRVVATVHGLDVILPIEAYQKTISRALKNLDRVICVSRATARQVAARGVPDERIEVIPNSAEKAPSITQEKYDILGEIRKLTGLDLYGRKVLFSLGRPIRRKGFDSFIKNVFPHLPEEFVYVVAGPPQKMPAWLKRAGPLLGKNTYNKLLLASGCDSIVPDLESLSRTLPRVYYLRDVSEKLRELLFAASDLFIMPNRTVQGDMEGFGIVALEAAARGVPVVATGIEGITDAVIHGENGYCIDENDNAGMRNAIISLTGDAGRLSEFGERARIYTGKHFSPEAIYSKYRKVFDELLIAQKN